MDGSAPRFPRAFAPRYTVHERAVVFSQTFSPPISTTTTTTTCYSNNPPRP